MVNASEGDPGFLSSAGQRWRVDVRNLETHLRIGIYAHEKAPQRIWVSATVEAVYPLKPASIGECFNYDHIHRLVTDIWPKRKHVLLLETCVAELLEYIFRLDSRVIYAKVGISKPDIFPEVQSVGVEAEWTRMDFERLGQA